MRKLLTVAFGTLAALLCFASTSHADATVDLLWADSGTDGLFDPAPGTWVDLQVVLTAGASGSAGAAVTVDYSEAVGALSVVSFLSNPSMGPELPLVLGETVDTGTQVKNVNAASIPPFLGPGLQAGQSYVLGVITFRVETGPGEFQINTTITNTDDILDLSGGSITGTSTLNSALVLFTAPVPALRATKSDALTGDVDGDGEADPGDTLHYTVEIESFGSADAQGVVFSDTPDANAPLVSGSVVTSQGMITVGNGAGDLSVEVDIGAIPSGSSVTVEFDAMVGALPPGVETVSNQGSVSATDVAAVLTDDPDTGPARDATVTEVVTPLEACQEEAAACSSDLGICESDLGTCQTELGTALSDLMTCQTNPPFEDADGDGEHDDRDACPGTAPGVLVDQEGCSLAEFCAGFDVSSSQRKSPCNQADWRNDEPLGAEDCKARQNVCEPR